MQLYRARQILSANYDDPVVTIDSHTGGECTRLIVDGIGDVPGATMGAKREYFREHLDHVRALLCREPRGHRDLLACAVTDPVTPGAQFGLVYMDAKRYPFLCGHATIGAVTTLVELGLATPHMDAEGGEHVTVDTPSGPMYTTLTRGEGGAVDGVSFLSVPAFVHGMDLDLHIPGLGDIKADTVCVGGFFVMVEAAQAGIDMYPGTAPAAIDLGMRIIEEANTQLIVGHPERPEVRTIDVVEFHVLDAPHAGRSFVIYGESHVDRSACGTGTTAKTTLLHRKGLLETGETYVNTGPLGTSFSGRVVRETNVGEFPAVQVEVTGSACITGVHEFHIDPRDPLPTGFLL